MFKKFMVLSALLLCVSSLSAFWVGEGPKREVETLFFVANYKSPVLLAEIIQSKSRQPYLLFPAGDRDTKIYFCPYKQNGTREVKESEITKFIEFLNPKRIIILGDERFVGKKFEALIPTAIPVFRASGSDWSAIAAQLGEMLPVSRLQRAFDKNRKAMDSAYRPLSAPEAAPVSADVVDTADTADAE